MVKVVYWISLILTVFWILALLYVNLNGTPLWGLDKDGVNSGISIFSLLVTITIGYFSWRYAYSNNKGTKSSRNMKIGNNSSNVIQINGDVKIRK